MAYDGYNTEAELRGICGMGAATPTSAVLEYWTNLIDAMIERYSASPSTEIAQLIEANRVSVLYWNLKHDNSTKNEMTLVISPLSMDEKEMLTTGNEDRTVWWD